MINTFIFNDLIGVRLGMRLGLKDEVPPKRDLVYTEKPKQLLF